MYNRLMDMGKNFPPELHLEFIEVAAEAIVESYNEGYEKGKLECQFPGLSHLSKLCVQAGLPEPEVYKKLWTTLVNIGDQYNRCYPDSSVAIKMAIQWVEGYLREQLPDIIIRIEESNFDAEKEEAYKKIKNWIQLSSHVDAHPEYKEE